MLYISMTSVCPRLDKFSVLFKFNFPGQNLPNLAYINVLKVLKNF